MTRGLKDGGGWIAGRNTALFYNPGMQDHDPLPASGSEIATPPTTFESSHAPLALDPVGAWRPWRWRYVIPAALVVLVVLSFMPALLAGFVDWDDDYLLLGNTRHQALTGENIAWMFTTSYSGHFQPLTWLSYAADYALWTHLDLDLEFGYHLTNVLLHAAAVVVFYFLTRVLLVTAVAGGLHDRAHVISRPIVLSSAFAAVLFAIHPLRVESVAWLAERRDVLSGVLVLLSVWLYVVYAGRSSSGLVARRFYLAALAFCAASLMSKASAMTLPFVLLVLDVYPVRRLGGSRRLVVGGCSRRVVGEAPFSRPGGGSGCSCVDRAAAGWAGALAGGT